jgi:ribosomal protein S18 acetylase RimI-like enzyme
VIATDAVTIAPASSVPTDAIRDCLNEAFSDYLIRLPRFDSDSWSGFLHRQGVEIGLSRVGVIGDRVISFALVTPRSADRWRIAVMGARPEVRGSGIAPRLLDETLADAQSRQLASVELEVFAQNTRALRLYQSRGMKPATALLAFDARASSRRAILPVKSVTHDAAVRRAREIEAGSDVSLPWQVCADAIRRLPGVPHCWQAGSAQMVFVEMTGRVLIQSLLDSDPDYARAADLLATLRDTYPEAALQAPQLQAEHGAAVAFRTAGWLQAELYQNLMVRSL